MRYSIGAPYAEMSAGEETYTSGPLQLIENSLRETNKALMRLPEGKTMARV